MMGSPGPIPTLFLHLQFLSGGMTSYYAAMLAMLSCYVSGYKNRQ